MTPQEQVKALSAIVSALIPYKETVATSKIIRDVIKDINLQDILNELHRADTALSSVSQPQPAPRTATAVTGKQYFHEVNKRGERCLELQKKWEDENGVYVEDPGSLPFLAQRPARCAKCAEIIGVGEEMTVRQRG